MGVYSLFHYISPGPHMDKYGRFDDRIWFLIPVSIDDSNGTVTYLRFPAGGGYDDIVEEEIVLSTGFQWTD